MLNEEFLHGWPINGAGFCQDLIYIQMNSFDLNKIIGLLQCFPCLEKLYIKVIISRTLEARI